MASVQTSPDTSQVRSVRATTWLNQGVHSRPWRSSPLAGPAFSTLPPIISESSSEDSHEKDNENDTSPPESICAFAQTHRSRSSSIVSDPHGSDSLCPSAYGSKNASGVTFVGSSSSISLPASSTLHAPSSQGHGNSQSHSHHSARLTKSRGGRCTSPTPLTDSRPTTDVPISPPPRARTISHGHARSATFPTSPVPPPSIPQTYSRASARPVLPETDTNGKQPSISRDPATNWMSSTPFGPAVTPKFSRLAMASPTVVMPISAREYRKRKAKESFDKGKDRDISSNHTVSDARPNGMPKVKVSPPPPSEDHPSRSLPASSGDISSTQSPPADPSKPLQASSMPAPTKTKRPHTPPRSSPLATQPPISPKSSSATFYSFASVSEDEPQGAGDPSMGATDAPVRRVPRRRRRSVPDRLSNGARLSLLEAVNRLSQVSAASQASGHTLFFDVELDKANTDQDEENGNDDEQACTPVLHTHSLEDLSSTLTRTGIEVVPEPAEEDGLKAKRNVRMVRISDTVEVSPAPVPRRRKLTKVRPGSVAGSVRGVPVDVGACETRQVKPVQAQERRSLLRWRSTKETKRDREVVDLGANGGLETSAVPGSTLNAPRKTRRYTFSFFTSSAQPPRSRNGHSKAQTAPAALDLGLASKSKPDERVGSGTDSTSTSIRTLTQGSQATLTPTSGKPVVPMMKRLNAQATALGLDMPTTSEQSASEGRETATTPTTMEGSTPSWGSASAGSLPPMLTLPDTIGESLLHGPSGLKASFTGADAEVEAEQGREKDGRQDEGESEGGAGAEDKALTYLGVNTRSSSSSSLSLPNPHPIPNTIPTLSASRPGTSSSTLTSATDSSYVSFSTLPASTVTSTTSTSRSTSSLSMDKEQREPKERGKMHPMFTVPLLTIPALAVSSHRSAEPGSGVPRYAGGRRERERHGSVGVGMGGVVSGDARAMAMPAVPPPSKSRTRRPQTAPADATFRFFEDVKSMEVREPVRKSKLKSVLMGLWRRA